MSEDLELLMNRSRARGAIATLRRAVPTPAWWDPVPRARELAFGRPGGHPRAGMRGRPFGIQRNRAGGASHALPK